MEDRKHMCFILKAIREELNIPKKEICYGLCHETTLTRIEEGKDEPGKWLADVLLERLGIFPAKFGCRLNMEEEKDYQCRIRVLFYLGQENPEGIEQQLRKYRQETKKRKKAKGELANINEKCQWQFLETVQLIKQMYLKTEEGAEGESSPERRLAKGEQEVLELIRWTIPGFEQERLKEFHLGRVEWTLVVLLADFRMRRKETRESGYFFYREILQQLQKQLTDEELFQEFYPYTIAMFTRHLTKLQDISGRWLCQKGIEWLRQWIRFYGLEAMLNYELCCASQEEAEEEPNGLLKEHKKQELYWMGIVLWTLQEVRNCYGKQEDGFPFYLANLLWETILGIGQGEQIRRKRMSLGWTREKLCDEVCSQKALTNIELGHQTPQAHTFRALSERLGQSGIRYIPFVFSDDYQMHVCYRRTAGLIAEGKFTEADFEWTMLERGLEQEGVKEEVHNQQMLLRLRAVIDSGRKKISQEEKLQILEKALALTVPPGIDLELWALEQSEIILLNNIANAKEAMEDYQGAIALLEAARKSCESGQNGIEWNKSGYLMILYNLSRYLGKVGQYQKEAEWIEKGIQLSYETRRGQFLGTFLYKKAWNLEEQYKLMEGMEEEKKKACLPLHRQAFSLAYFFGQQDSMIKIRNRCQNEYGIQIELEYK